VATATVMRSDSELASALRICVMRLARRLRNERSSDADLTVSQLAALSSLDRHGSMTPRELATHERVQPPSMTRILGQLEELGLVERTPHSTDGRQVLVTPTTQATTMLREDRRRRDAWLATRLRTLTSAERDTLRAATSILERLAQA
jgi:DNA-binding MarR family transcriptional regulator